MDHKRKISRHGDLMLCGGISLNFLRKWRGPRISSIRVIYFGNLITIQIIQIKHTQKKYIRGSGNRNTITSRLFQLQKIDISVKFCEYHKLVSSTLLPSYEKLESGVILRIISHMMYSVSDSILAYFNHLKNSLRCTILI